MGIYPPHPSHPPEVVEGVFANLARHVRNGVAHCRMVFDGETPVDWIYLHVNEAFTEQTGLVGVAGRRATEVIPGLAEQDPELLAIYGRVVSSGESAKFERHVKALDMWFAVSVYRCAPGEFVAVFDVVTERKRAEEALRASEARFRAVFEQAAVGIAQMDASGSFLRANRTLCALLGYDEAELCTMSYPAITHPDHAATDRDLHRKLVSDPTTPITFEKRLLRKDGGAVWARVTISRADGSEPFYVAIVEDVTAQKAAEASLRASEQRLRATFDLAPVGIAESDPTTGRWRYVNHRVCEITGYAAEELRELSIIDDITHPDDRDVSRAWVQALRAGTKGATHREKRYLRKDGSVASVAIDVAILRDEEGHPTGTLAAIEDVTEKKRAEAALQASQERYRDLVENLDDVVLSLDSDGAITFINRAILHFGYEPEALLGVPLVDLLHADDQAAFGLLLSETPNGIPQEVRLYDAGGKIRHVRASLRWAAAERNAGRVGVLVDLTHQRETEAQLFAAQKMEAVGRLAGGVAHDFNNLLSVILSYAELALEALPPEQGVIADLKEVMKAGLRAEGLTRQLLAFSRRQLLEPELVDVNALVAGVGNMLIRLVGEDIKLTIAPGEALHTIRADRGQLEQVLMNLVVNARDAMPAGGKLHIGTRNVQLDGDRASALALPAGPYVELVVADSGCGMDEDTCARIFEPFFTTKGQGKGTGLGLAMVYGITRQSGGAITVESVPDEGSVFRLYLPKHEGAPLRTTPPPAPAGQTGRGTETLLVVDDEPALAAVVARVLAASGYDVHVANTPEEALVLCHREGERFSLVLTDVIMPGMNGRELVERITPLCPEAKFMFMSGYTDDLLEKYGVLGASLLRKPFDWRTIATRVRAMLDGDSMRV